MRSQSKASYARGDFAPQLRGSRIAGMKPSCLGTVLTDTGPRAEISAAVDEPDLIPEMSVEAGMLISE